MQPLKTTEESLALIRAYAENYNGRIAMKVYRRKPGIGTFLHQATFGDCDISHVTALESWLPRIFGGGQLFVRCFTGHDGKNDNIGDHMEFNFDQPAFAHNDYSAIARAGSQWPGPTLVTFPDLNGSPPNQPNAPPSQVGSPGTGSGGPQFQRGNGLPDGNQHQAHSQPIGGETALARELLAKERQLIEREAQLNKAMMDREAQFTAQLTAQKADLERERFETRLRAESEAAQRRHAEEMSELKRLIAGNAAPAKPALDVQALITGLAPLFLQLVQANAARQDAMMAQQREFTQALLTKPTGGITPEMQLLIETLKNQGGGSADMMSRIVDAMSTVSKTSVGMIEAIADLNLGGAPEHPLLMAVKEGVKAMAHLSRGAESGARRALQPRNGPAPQLPPRLPPPNVQQQMAPQQVGVQHPVPAAQARPANVTPFPPRGAPVPVPHAPASFDGHNGAPEVIVQAPVVPSPNVPPAFDGVAPPKQLQPEKNAVDQLEMLIRSKHEPRDEVVHFFFAALDTPEMKAELGKYGGDVDAMVTSRLEDWIGEIDNLEYLKALGDMIEEVGEERGMWADEPEEDAEAAEAAE